MKKLFYAIAITLVIVACGSKPSVVGNWQLNSVSGEELTDSEKSATVTFNEDGTFSQKRGDHERTGTYKLSDDGKTLSITKEGSDEADSWSDVKLEGDLLSFVDGNDTITLKKK